MTHTASLSSEERKSAIKLYQSGYSMQQVADKFNVKIDAIVYTLRSHNISRRSAHESQQLKFAQKPPSFHIKEKLTNEEEQLKMAAIMLYWAEGYKVGTHTVDFANSDPVMALLFKKFLTDICVVNQQRIRCLLYCYEGQNVEELTRFWSTFLDIPESQFTKPYVKKQISPGVRGPRMTSGLVHIRYCDKKLLQQILIWIDEYAEKCVGGRVVNCTTL